MAVRALQEEERVVRATAAAALGRRTDVVHTHGRERKRGTSSTTQLVHHAPHSTRLRHGATAART